MVIREAKKKIRIGHNYNIEHEDSKGKYETQDWGWEGLPAHILDMISERLPLIDYISFSRVCKSWSSVMKQVFPLKQPRGFPWLVMSQQEDSLFRSFYSLFEHKLRKLKLTEALMKYIWGSFEDWLILVKPVTMMEGNGIQITLLNPFTGALVHLPETSDAYHKLVLSKSPLDETCMYMLVGCTDFSLWIPGRTQEWYRFGFQSPLNSRHDYIMDAIFFKGSFYLLIGDYSIRVLDAAYISSKINKQGSSPATMETQAYVHTEASTFPNKLVKTRNLVESDGKILLVCRFFIINDLLIPSENLGTKIFRLDIEKKMAWIALNDLGDQILFIGKNCCKSYSSKELGVGSAGSVYFINKYGPPLTNEWEITSVFPIMEVEDNDWGVYRRGSYIDLKVNRWEPIWLTVPIWWCCS